jgi:hypothetical protein
MVSVNHALYLQPAIDRLQVAVLEHNRPGSVEGLLSHHVLKDDPRITFDWQVLCTQAWMDSEFRPSTLDHVAALGYSFRAQPNTAYAAQLLDGLTRISERDAFKGDHLSIARNPTRLLGVILGCLALGEPASQTLQWCRDVLEAMRQKGLTGFDPLVPYLFYQACGAKIPIIPDTAGARNLYELAFTDWAIRQGMQQNEPAHDQLTAERNRILFEAATNLKFTTASQAAFIWSALTSILFHALGSASLKPSDVAAVLKNFEPAMKRWRFDGSSLQKPIQWPVTQEREVQDILWVILRSYFTDVVDEDTLPRLGHSTYRADFGIGSLKLIIEAKFATSKDDFKQIEKGILEDSFPYLRDLRYESLIVFIYDDSASVQEHDTTRRALMEIPGVVDVVIVSRPSQLRPKSKSPQKGPAKRAQKQGSQ